MRAICGYLAANICDTTGQFTMGQLSLYQVSYVWRVGGMLAVPREPPRTYFHKTVCRKDGGMAAHSNTLRRAARHHSGMPRLNSELDPAFITANSSGDGLLSGRAAYSWHN